MGDFRIDEGQLEKIFEEWDCHSPFLVPKQQMRIEALRAASRIVAGMCVSKQVILVNGQPADLNQFTVGLSKILATYLEGE